MDIKLNLSYYASIMHNAFKDLLFYAQNYANIIGLGILVASPFHLLEVIVPVPINW